MLYGRDSKDRMRNNEFISGECVLFPCSHFVKEEFRFDKSSDKGHSSQGSLKNNIYEVRHKQAD